MSRRFGEKGHGRRSNEFAIFSEFPKVPGGCSSNVRAWCVHHAWAGSCSMFVVRMSWAYFRMRALADQRGIIYAAGSNFHIRGEDIPYLRLAFGFASLEAIQEGVPLLGQSIRQACALHAVAV